MKKVTTVLGQIFGVPMHLVAGAITIYSLVGGHMIWQEAIGILGAIVIFGLIGATKPLWT